VLLLAVALGLLIGKQAAEKTEPLVIPFLAIVMSLSAMNVTTQELAQLKKMHRTVAYSLLLNYLVLGGIIWLMAWWLIPDEEIRTGFIMLAVVPPAVAVLPFTYLLGGDSHFSLIGMTGTYLAALLIVPAAMLLFLGLDFFDPWKLLIILVELIIVPIIVSRILLHTGAARYINRYRGTAVNWCYSVVVFTLVGLNQKAFFGEFDVLLRVALIAAVISFVLGYVLELIAKSLHLRHELTLSIIFMGTLKNYGLAGGILLALFTDRSVIPVSVSLVFGIFLFVWLGFHFRKKVNKPDT